MDIVSFKFAENLSIADFNSEIESNITDFVNNYLKEHGTNIGATA